MSNTRAYRKEILGVCVDFGLDYDAVVQRTAEMMSNSHGCYYICTTNPEFVIDAQGDPEFKDIINKATLSLPDGAGIVIAKRYLEETDRINGGFCAPVRKFITGLKVGVQAVFKPGCFENTVTGVELVEKLLEMCNKDKRTVFLLGGRYRDRLGRFRSDSGDLAGDVSRTINEKYPNINIVGATSVFSHKIQDDDKSVAYIKSTMSEHNVTHIDLLLVAYNHVNQEKWINRNATYLPALVSVGVGGTFDYIVGYQKKEPPFIRNIHLGWLYRLITQPWRIKRVVRASLYFPFKVFFNSIQQHT